jgi:hypothetical protein
MAKSTQVILGMFKEDFEVNNCLEWSQYIQGQTTQPCLKNEKFLVKKGTTFQSKRNNLVLNSGTSVFSDDSYVNIPYQNGEFSVPLSKIIILEFKYVTNNELMNFKNNFDTTNNQNTQSKNKIVSFLESHPKLIMTVFIGIGLYIGYKKFMK